MSNFSFMRKWYDNPSERLDKQHHVLKRVVGFIFKVNPGVVVKFVVFKPDSWGLKFISLSNVNYCVKLQEILDENWQLCAN
ncbi:hypothetical protein PQU96_11540 [Vogesella sp. LYT5W]|uniref:Uncharacterized protein n=1 Tax=Vogesella margarita TaxID=2984199 RepID=A0ABT5IQE3_9NEIS|nr:hypothetical protein [Vogesella margarita]MDC7714748.1 hypothetical protein [Vogesella margarita]